MRDGLTARTSSAAGTEALGRALATVLRTGDTVLLAGDLGAGKTTFTKGIADELGVTERVTSPTFTLVRSYECARDLPAPPGSRGVAIRTLVHADLFRLDHLKEVVELAIEELVDQDAVAVVEWGDVAIPVLGHDCLVVRLAHGPGEYEREVTLDVPPEWRARLGRLRDVLADWADRAEPEDRQE